MTIKYYKNIEENTINKLKARMYLADSMKSVIASITTIKDLDITDDKFKDLIEEYQDKFIIANMYRDQLSSSFIPHECKAIKNNITYSYDFLFNTLTIIFEADSDKYSLIDEILVNNGWVKID